MRRLQQLTILVMILGSSACGGSEGSQTTDAQSTDTGTTLDATVNTTADTGTTSDTVSQTGTLTAYIFQVVNNPTQWVNGLRVGVTTDGYIVDSSKTDTLLSWAGGLDGQGKNQYGDPVISWVSSSKPWRLTARAGDTDPRGPKNLLYWEGSCPQVNENEVKSIGVDTSPGCKPTQNLVGGKTSQVFSVPGEGEFLLFNSGSAIHLLRLSDATHQASQLSSVCVLQTPVTKLSDLQWGQATPILGGDQHPQLYSDSAIGRRTNGTWVMYVKSRARDTLANCANGSLCELCTREIHVTTSTDLINWETPTVALTQCSVPYTHTDKDGAVWLYWQDFSESCTANDQTLAARAPILGAKEQADFSLGSSAKVSFPNEGFQSTTTEHYATNGNPVLLPTQQAIDAFTSCLP